ncbi:MAG TPA: hydroxymethylglutaryl-CoA lyase [Mycobacteriales bacterium]|nr:hydroxymethylglutaryl-CoA lyase [Mycobacteriales bacterium]
MNGVRERVEIVEVSPRDGLQNEQTTLDTATKVELITRLVDAGARRLEATSFVNPKRVPQMADAEQVMAAVPRRDGVTYVGLVLNERGLDRALAAGVDEVNFVVVASEEFSRRNQGVGIAETVVSVDRMVRRAHSAGVSPTVTVGAAFGCPFSGEVPVDRVTDLVRRVLPSGPVEIALADTIGVAAPTDVTRRVGAVAEVAGSTPLRCHFHNTRNTGIANAYAAVLAGVSALDTSLGGVGGCPFAPRATGNVPTEDVAYMLDRMGTATGLALDALIDSATWLESRLGRTLPGMLAKAGPFPR